jgi:hypothetical protein
MPTPMGLPNEKGPVRRWTVVELTSPLRRLRLRPASLAAFACAIAAVSAAQAQPSTQAAAVAEALYADGKKLYAAGDYPAACAKFEESVRVDPAPGSKNALAKCFERIGRPASAWSLYREVATEAGLKGEAQRASDAQKAAAALEPTLPKLTIRVSDEAASIEGLEVERDGIAVGKAQWAIALPVDLGEHAIVATAPGKRAWQGKVRVPELGAQVSITVPALASAPLLSGTSPQRAAGISIGAVGVAGLVAGGVLGGVAASRWSSAKEAAKAGGCVDATRYTGCDQATIDKQASATSFATASTIALVAGGVLAAGGVVLFATAPRAKAQAAAWVTPAIAPGVLGLTAGGAF